MKNKRVKLPFVTKNSNVSFCLLKHFVGRSGDDWSAVIESTPLRKTKVLTYKVTKNKNISLCLFKHLVGRIDDDLSALIEFLAPLKKTRVSNYQKIKNITKKIKISRYIFARSKNKTIVACTLELFQT